MQARGKGLSPGRVEGSSRAMLATARPSCNSIRISITRNPDTARKKYGTRVSAECLLNCTRGNNFPFAISRGYLMNIQWTIPVLQNWRDLSPVFRPGLRY